MEKNKKGKVIRFNRPGAVLPFVLGRMFEGTFQEEEEEINILDHNGSILGVIHRSACYTDENIYVEE